MDALPPGAREAAAGLAAATLDAYAARGAALSYSRRSSISTVAPVREEGEGEGEGEDEGYAPFGWQRARVDHQPRARWPAEEEGEGEEYEAWGGSPPGSPRLSVPPGVLDELCLQSVCLQQERDQLAAQLEEKDATIRFLSHALEARDELQAKYERKLSAVSSTLGARLSRMSEVLAVSVEKEEAREARRHSLAAPVTAARGGALSAVRAGAACANGSPRASASASASSGGGGAWCAAPAAPKPKQGGGAAGARAQPAPDQAVQTSPARRLEPPRRSDVGVGVKTPEPVRPPRRARSAARAVAVATVSVGVGGSPPPPPPSAAGAGAGAPPPVAVGTALDASSGRRHTPETRANSPERSTTPATLPALPPCRGSILFSLSGLGHSTPAAPRAGNGAASARHAAALVRASGGERRRPGSASGARRRGDRRGDSAAVVLGRGVAASLGLGPSASPSVLSAHGLGLSVAASRAAGAMRAACRAPGGSSIDDKLDRAVRDAAAAQQRSLLARTLSEAHARAVHASSAARGAEPPQ